MRAAMAVTICAFRRIQQNYDGATGNLSLGTQPRARRAGRAQDPADFADIRV
jgi:hypothetical protein